MKPQGIIAAAIFRDSHGRRDAVNVRLRDTRAFADLCTRCRLDVRRGARLEGEAMPPEPSGTK
jgi:hypothetical protein